MHTNNCANVTPRLARRVRELVSSGCSSREISRATGLSISTVHQIRQGRYDEAALRQRFRESSTDEDAADTDECETNPNAEAECLIKAINNHNRDGQAIVVWCPRCRCHIHPPCQLCRLKAYQQRQAEEELQSAQQTGTKLFAQQRITNVAQLGLSTRLLHIINRSGIETVKELLLRTYEDLMLLPGVGPISLQQIARALAVNGFPTNRLTPPRVAAANNRKRKRKRKIKKP